MSSSGAGKYQTRCVTSRLSAARQYLARTSEIRVVVSNVTSTKCVAKPFQIQFAEDMKTLPEAIPGIIFTP